VISTWNIMGPEGTTTEELLVAFDRGRTRRLLVCPAWFDEANKLRRFTVEVMRRLDNAGIDSFLPDLPGCNDSLAPAALQTLPGWRAGMKPPRINLARPTCWRSAPERCWYLHTCPGGTMPPSPGPSCCAA
jgi:hypothetical protein